METLFIEKLKKVDSIVERYDDVTGEIAGTARSESGVTSAEVMEQELAKVVAENRLLSIGIVGRVKAGKSSLLNALFFGGKQILPKAATPMTAALTIIRYDENPHAEIDFFTPQDIAFIKQEYEAFTQHYEKKRQEAEKKAREDEKKRKIPYDQKKIERMVKREMGNHPKVGSFEQYEQMKKSGKLAEFSTSGRNTTYTITGDEISALMNSLSNYVSADGQYMPFTKSVTLYLNIEDLKDIQVVDTPGINDPIKSREERTEHYLGECDVVFVVSPAGEFLSDEDLNLMGHISGKKGVDQVFLTASRFDQQLYGSEKERAEGILPNVIENIRTQLVTHAKEVCSKRKQQNPECSEMYQSLLDDAEHRVLITSSMCHSMHLLFNQQDAWDEDMQYTWGLLSEDYPDYFSGEAAQTSLEKLAGVSAVRNNVGTVRQKKDEIIQKKQQAYAEQQTQNVDAYLEKLKNSLREAVDRLKNTDAAELQAQKEAKEKMRVSASADVDEAFDEAVFNFKTGLSTTLKQNSRGLFDDLGDFSSYEKTESKTVTRSREKSGILSGVGRFFGGFLGTDWGYEDYQTTETYRTMQTAPIKRKVNDLALNLQADLEDCAEKAVMEWRGIVQQKTISALRRSLEDENMIDIPLLKTSIRKVIGNMKIPEFKLSGAKFGDNYSGKLTDDEIDSFLSEIDEHLAELRSTYASQIKSFLNQMEASAKQDTLSSLLFSNLDKELKVLEQQIENKKSTLARYDTCIKELSATA